MHLRDFDFTLPAELIAQAPADKRDGSRLMIVDRRQGSIRHDGFANVGDYLRAGDVLVVNDTKVIPARLRGRKAGTGGSVEVLLLHDLGGGAWEVLLKPAAKAPPGTEVVFGEGKLRGRVGERTDEGAVVLNFTPPDVLPALAEVGEVPLPPYIKRQQPAESRDFDLERYQTVYACPSRRRGGADRRPALHAGIAGRSGAAGYSASDAHASRGMGNVPAGAQRRRGAAPHGRGTLRTGGVRGRTHRAGP